MSHRRSTVKGSLSFANPTVRAWLFQILAVVAVVGVLIHLKYEKNREDIGLFGIWRD